jgi:hypothetical protein
MQYVEYEYAKENKIVGKILYAWMKLTPDLTLETRGKIIRDWRFGALLLNVGDRGPRFVNQRTLNDWTKHQIDKDYHQKSYQSAYLKGYFKL